MGAAASTGNRTDRVRRRPPLPLAATIALLGIVGLLLGVAESYLAVVVLASVAVLVGSFHYVLRSSRAFAFALANLIGIYACIFLFFAESNFDELDTLTLSAGFLMPLAAFLLGSLRRRNDIGRVVLAGRKGEERRFAEFLRWLVPVFGVGALTFTMPHGPDAVAVQTAGMLGGMLVISAIVYAVSHDVAVFLLDTGILFEAFFARAARLMVPAFAFLTFYSLLVIVFASFYSIVDHLTAAPNFRIDGVLRPLRFPETLYFSLTTLSTVGYGDVSPASNLVRLVSGVEIVCGILLLLFGFNEIFSFAQVEARRQRHDAARDNGDD
jgi:voltage-gated potassium channel